MNELLDLLYPYAGPCAFCGYKDKRHRLADSLIENVRGGDSPSLVARLYSGGSLEISTETVEKLVAYANKRKQQRKARWPK